MSGKGQYNVIVEMDDEPTIQVRSNKMCWMLAGMLIMLVEKKTQADSIDNDVLQFQGKRCDDYQNVALIEANSTWQTFHQAVQVTTVEGSTVQNNVSTSVAWYCGFDLVVILIPF
jgi:hypothetical protein